MGRPGRNILTGLLVALATLSASGRAQTPAESASEAFAAGTAAFAEQDYQRALERFEASLDAGMQGPAVHYNIAVSHYRLENYEAAGAEFALIADRFPAMRALAQYNLGLVAQRLGDDEAAERRFRQALENTDDETIRRLASSQLTPRAVVENARWFRQINTRISHDDNVRLLSDDVPLRSGQSAESLSTEFWASISGPLTSAPGFRFDGSLYSVRYQDAPFYDQNYLQLGGVYRWQWGSWLAEAGPQLSVSTVDGDGYEDRFGLTLRLRRDLNPQLAFRARVSHDEVDAGDQRFAFVEGSRDWLELSLDHRNAEKRVIFSYALESNDRGPNIASTRQKLSLRYSYAFSPRWETDIEGSFRRSSYDDLAQPRDEDLTALSFGLTRQLAREWEINGTLALYDNSAIAFYSYDRNRFSIALSKSFY